MSIVEVGNFAKFLICQDKNKERWYASINSVMLNKAEELNVRKVKYAK